MTILFYSTNASFFSFEDFDFYTWPSRSSLWEKIAAAYPDHRFIIATSFPGYFLTDSKPEHFSNPSPSASEAPMPSASAAEKSSSSRVSFYHIKGENASQIASELLALKPSVAVSATFWVPPYDWLGLQDSMVSELLTSAGVKTFCHSSRTALQCFDKNMTSGLLSSLGFSVPKSVYVHHELYWCERRHKELKNNVYKDYVLSQIEKLHYPVVIKDTVGLSSYSMEVAVSYKQALMYLNSGRTTCDRLVEEFIDGQQFGCEIYGSAGSYTVLPPFAFSVNRYGITSPKQSVKLGPVLLDSYEISRLKSQLTSLACALDLSPCAQIDLIFKDGQWYIIEINPRLSGMTETYAASLGLSSIELLLKTVLSEKKPPLDDVPLRSAINFKLPILTPDQLEKVCSFPAVSYVHQVFNKVAKQEREKGYCEVVLTSDCSSSQESRNFSSLMEAFETFAEKFSDIMEDVFVKNARSLAASLK